MYSATLLGSYVAFLYFSCHKFDPSGIIVENYYCDITHLHDFGEVQLWQATQQKTTTTPAESHKMTTLIDNS